MFGELMIATGSTTTGGGGGEPWNIVTDGLQSLYLLDSDATDYFGNVNLTNSGTITYETRGTRDAGTPEYGAELYSFGHAYTSAQAVSFGGWFYMEAGRANNIHLINHYWGTRLAICTDYPSFGNISLRTYDTAYAYTVSSLGNITSNQWTHIMTTYNPTTLEAKLYVDGVLAGTKSLSTQIGYLNYEFDIGFANGSLGLSGSSADSIRFYNRELSADDVYDIYYGETAYYDN